MSKTSGFAKWIDRLDGVIPSKKRKKTLKEGIKTLSGGSFFMWKNGSYKISCPCSGCKEIKAMLEEYGDD